MTKARDIAEFPENLNIGEKTNLLTNGDFTTDTSNWTATTATLSINSSRLQIIPDASVNGFANQQVDNLVVGRSYIASVDIIQDAAPFGRLYIGTSANGNQTVTSSNLGVGTHSFTFVATATTHHFALVVGGGTQQTTIFDNARLTEANTITFPAISGTSPTIRQGTTVNDLAIATNNINRLNITNDGHVTKPNQPMFRIRCNAVQNVDASGDRNISGSDYQSNTLVQAGGTNFNISTGRFTAPVSGYYYFAFSNRIDSFGGSYFYFTILDGGGSVITRNLTSLSTTYHTIHCSAVHYMSANDYVYSRLSVTGDTNIRMDSDGFFSGFLIG